jgi:Protein of unknown function (DUF2442).
MHLSVKEVKTLNEYKLLLTLKNGEVRLFDMSPYLEKGIFRELKDLSLFKSARISFDTVEWENEADIDTETLYENSVPYNIS